MKQNNSFFKQILQLSIGSIINLIIGVLTTPIITRLVDPNEYGQLNIFTTYSTIALMIFTLGLDQTFLRFYYTNDAVGYKKKLLGFCLGLPIYFTTVGFIILVLIYFLFPGLLAFDSVVLWCFIAYVYILILNRFGMLVLRLQYKTALYSAMNILHKALYVVIVIPFVIIFKKNYLYILVIATLGSMLIPSIVCILSERHFWFVRLNVSKYDLSKKELLKYGFPLMISSGVFILFQATDKLCVKYFGTYSDVGVYSSAQSLMAVFSIIQSTFNTLWAPKAIEHYELHPDDRSFYIKMNHIITVLMFVFGACVLFGKDLFVMLLGEKYREASTIIPFLMFNPIMYTISETTVTGLSITKHTSSQVLITTISAIVNFIGNIVLIPILGPKGAAVSTGLSYIVFFTLRTIFSNHYFPIDYKLKRFYLLTLVFAVGCVYHMFHAFDYIIVGIFVVTMVLVVLLYFQTIKEIFNIVKLKILEYRNKSKTKSVSSN